MKFLLLASFALLCTASSVYQNRNISVNDDGNILITAPNGRRVVISRAVGPDGGRNIDISVSGPYIPTRTIHVGDNTLENAEIRDGNTPWSSVDSVSDEYRLKRGSSSSKSQGDILTEILREYQGVVDQVQYEKLLNRINKAVKKGEISPQVFDLLEQLDQQQQYQQGVYGQQYGQQYAPEYRYGQQYGQQYAPEYRYGQQYAQQYAPEYRYGQQYGQQYAPEYRYGQQYGQQQGVYGQQYGSRYGVRSGVYGYGSVVPQEVSQYLYSNQIPTGNYYRGQYYGTTRYVNPLLQRGQTSYVNDLLANQQYAGVQGGLSRYGSQGTLSRGLTGSNSGLLRQVLGYQQTPYVQRQIVSGTNQYYGQQQQVEQLSQVEQAIEQLIQIQQQLQQQNVPQYVQPIEQLVQLQQQLQQQQNGQQAVQVLEQLEQIQQLLQGQNVPVQQVAQAIAQLNQIQYQRPTGLLSEVQQQQQIAQVEEALEQLNEIQQQQQLGGVRQPIVQRYGQRFPVGQQTVGQQLRSGPWALQQLTGLPQYQSRVGGYYYNQPISRGYRTGGTVGVQGRTGSYLNTVPQLQVVY